MTNEPIEYVEATQPTLSLIVVGSNSLEEVGRDLQRQDPINRRLIVANNYTEIPLDPGADLAKIELLDFADYEYEVGPEVLRHLYAERRGAYVASDRGAPESLPYVAFAGTLRQMPDLRITFHQRVRKLANSLPLDAPTVYVVFLVMATAGMGNGISLPICATFQGVERLIKDQASLHTIQIVVESSRHDERHADRVNRQLALKASYAAVAEAATGLSLAGVELTHPFTSECYFIDAPGGTGEASEPEMNAFVFEMVSTMLDPALRAQIDGTIKQWGSSKVFGIDTPVAGAAGHVVAEFARDELAEAGVSYQMPAIYDWLERS